jgi:Flp pilus assembly protein TadG
MPLQNAEDNLDRGKPDMLSKAKRLLKSIRRESSGNVMMIVALGMPVFIGGAGLAVDFSQWYLWKRELQYAVDQAALAGAWARTNNSTKPIYETRALQEYNANVAVVEDFDTGPTIGLANYSGGIDNSVTVSASATKSLPFSNFLTGNATTISVYAQASYTLGASFTSCLIATDEDADGAITLGGNSVLTAGCGMAALSSSDQAIIVDGNPTIDAGYILAKGGIDDWLDTHTDDEIHEYLAGLYDPFATLSPPNPAESQINRTYTCVKGSKTTKATVTTGAETVYSYWKGADYNTAVPTTYNKAKNKAVQYFGSTFTTVANDTVDGVTTTVTTKWTAVNGSTTNTVWEKAVTTTTTTQSGTTVTTTPDQATTLPGTYSTIKVACLTTFAPGVYIIDGGGLEIDGQYTVTGSAVMFVLKNGAYVKINGGSNINLTAMQASDLTARGVSAADANKLAGMLIFEARDSQGTNRNIINGNASTVLNGTIYLPVSGLTFSGTASVTSQCLMIAANTITLTGDANMSTFCPAGVTEDTEVANEVSTVKLVA